LYDGSITDYVCRYIFMGNVYVRQASRTLSRSSASCTTPPHQTTSDSPHGHAATVASCPTTASLPSQSLSMFLSVCSSTHPTPFSSPTSSTAPHPLPPARAPKSSRWRNHICSLPPFSASRSGRNGALLVHYFLMRGVLRG
jgi:hypothetical protein